MKRANRLASSRFSPTRQNIEQLTNEKSLPFNSFAITTVDQKTYFLLWPEDQLSVPFSGIKPKQTLHLPI